MDYVMNHVHYIINHENYLINHVNYLMKGIVYANKCILHYIMHCIIIHQTTCHLNLGTNCDANGTSNINFVSKSLCTADHCHQPFIYYII